MTLNKKICESILGKEENTFCTVTYPVRIIWALFGLGARFLMVHLVLERPRESVLPLLIQHCIGSNKESSKNPKGVRTDVSRKPFWSIAFPIYYVLLSFTCNVLFLVGSCLFLPIKSSQASVSFTFVVENIDVDKVMTSNKGDLFEQLENNFTGALASDQSNRIKPHHTHFQWRKTTSCSLDEAMLFDVNIYPRDGHNITALQSSLPSVQTISHALNSSFAANGIDEVATGQVQVNIVNRPRIMETSVVQKWAVDFGCTLFIIGSALLAAISGLDLLEDMLTCGLKLPSPKTLTQGYEFLGSEPSSTLPPDAPVVVSARAERLLYLTGGLIFLIGTFYFQHPQMVSSRVPSEVMQDEDVLYAAIWMFIIGSIIFVFATFLNALSLNSSGRTFAHWAVATCGIYELGGILFVMGSVCFMPNQGCKEGMEILGAWCFIVGAACYMLGDFIEFMKTCALIFLRLKQEEAARQIERAMLCYLFRRRLESVGRLTRSYPVPTSKSAPSRGRRESLKEVGLVRAFTEALGQQPIIQALQLRDIPKLECAGAFDRRKELLPPTGSWPLVSRPMV